MSSRIWPAAIAQPSYSAVSKRRQSAARRRPSNFFDGLGVRPILGRAFLAGEDAVGAPHAAILSYGLWEREIRPRSELLGESQSVFMRRATCVDPALVLRSD